MVKISSVEKNSSADKAGILPGDKLISINGNTIKDVLDYRFYLTDSFLSVVVERDGEEKIFTIKKDEYDDIGLEFETYLMDKKHSCKNGCVFCFVDQLPKGMRDTLYFKDDDSRLSFLMGNYITLTGLTDEDADRIVKMHMSPINISVHTTNPELRCRMMKNRFAGQSLDYMKKFADAGIVMNCQIVLCKGLNDGEELINTMHDLSLFYPHVASVSIVPVGLTNHRDGLYPLEPFNQKEAYKVVKDVENFAFLCKKYYGSSIFFCGDELYLKAGLDLPSPDYYEDFSQIENGVGMISSMKEEFESALEEDLNIDKNTSRNVSLATGEAAYPFICSLTEKLKETFPNLCCKVYEIKNNFFGENINVAGLITGKDLYEQLKGQDLGDELIIPDVMLESTGKKFLDDFELCELEKELNIKIKATPRNGEAFILSVMGVD